jgi:hypothetical protein
MSNPGPTHIAAAKRILRYLAGTRVLGITYWKNAADASLKSIGIQTVANELSASADADHAGADDRRSVSGCRGSHVRGCNGDMGIQETARDSHQQH